MNDVDLIGSGLAQLIVVARLCAWRGVRTEASRFGGFRGHQHSHLIGNALLPSVSGGDGGVSLVLLITAGVTGR
jgi:hypothetical protein